MRGAIEHNFSIIPFGNRCTRILTKYWIKSIHSWNEDSRKSRINSQTEQFGHWQTNKSTIASRNFLSCWMISNNATFKTDIGMYAPSDISQYACRLPGFLPKNSCHTIHSLTHSQNTGTYPLANLGVHYRLP